MVQVTLSSGCVLTGTTVSNPALLPWSGDTTADADTYRSRNAAKSNDCSLFSGIPYAHPPVGTRRWTPAEMLPSPPGTAYDATQWRNISPQTTTDTGDYSDKDGRPSTGIENGTYEESRYPVTQSEDCLFLHIWTPDIAPASPLPVIVFCHGGGNTKNHAAIYATRGNRLVHKGVVFVTFEYRLSTLGFFHASAFAGDAGIQGNYAYSDAIAALRWVQANIDKFGGDPNCVTIMGGSAGGAMIQALMTTSYPVGETLFHRAFAVAGGGLGQRLPLADAQARGDAMLAALRRDWPAASDPTRSIAQLIAGEGDAAGLRKGPSTAQILAWGNSRNKWPFKWDSATVTPYTSTDVNDFPIKDGTICAHDTVIDAIRAGALRPGVPLMLESVPNEAGLINNARDLTTLDGYWATAGATDKTRVMQAQKVYGKLTDELKRQVWGDVVFNYPNYRIAHEAKTVAATVFLNYFRYDTFGSGATEPSHTTETNYWLGQCEWLVGLNTATNEAKIYEFDLRLSAFLMQALANFAKTGNPNTAYASPYDLNLYATAPALGVFSQYWKVSRTINLIDNAVDDTFTAGSAPVLRNKDSYNNGIDYDFARWDLFDGWLYP